MTNHALISVHPNHVENMIAGVKTVELRRTNLHLSPGQELWIYSTVPASRIEVVASVGAVHRLTPAAVWRRFGSRVAISRMDFDIYVGNRSLMTAIELTAVRKLRNPVVLSDLRGLSIGFHPPQLAFYLSDSDPLVKTLLRRKQIR